MTTPDPEAHDALEDRVVTALRAEGLLREARPPFARRIRALAASAALLGAGFAGGLWGPSLVARPVEGQDYVMLLHSGAGYREESMPGARAREYGAWARAVDAREAADIVTASELADTSIILAAGQSRQAALPAGPLGKTVGFFVIRASSDAEARAIAASSPHLRYGGSVTLTGAL
jgi:hypothetical protein